VRNLAPLTLEPGEHFNVFYGDNGQGKTNLLETVFVVSTLRSFRTQRLAELIAFDVEEAHIGARVQRDELTRVYELVLKQRSRRVRLDGKTVRPVSRYFGQFNVVLFSPEDLLIPKGSPGARRRFLDRAVFNRQPAHLSVVRDYEKAIKSRNTLLKDAMASGALNRDLLAVYDEQVATLGARLVAARIGLLVELAPHFRRAFDAITKAGLSVDVRYDSTLELVEGTPPVDDIAEALRGQLADARATDLRRTTTSVGPHRDDITFRFADRAASSFASQGQLRALVLAWKTSELELLEQVHGEAPILLLDDVSSELDATRNEYLFEFLRHRHNQCFITTTHPKHVLLSSNRRDYEVVGGRIHTR